MFEVICTFLMLSIFFLFGNHVLKAFLNVGSYYKIRKVIFVFFVITLNKQSSFRQPFSFSNYHTLLEKRFNVIHVTYKRYP